MAKITIWFPGGQISVVLFSGHEQCPCTQLLILNAIFFSHKVGEEEKVIVAKYSIPQTYNCNICIGQLNMWPIVNTGKNTLLSYTTGTEYLVLLIKPYLLLHLPAPPHPPWDEQWGALLHRCMLGTPPVGAEAHGDLACVPWCAPHLRQET